MSRWVVVKVGGGVAEDPIALGSIIEDLKDLVASDVKVALMHGGGPQATRLTGALGHETRMVGGRRVTDAPTLEVMKMVLGGQVATDMLSMCRKKGLRAVHVSGVADAVIVATKRPPRIVSGGGDAPVDFGFVGDIESVNTDLIKGIGSLGVVPVMNSLGADAEGEVLNINADIAATRLAVALQAEALFLLTGAPGVLKDPNDWDSRISKLSRNESAQYIQEGVIGGGMIPKLEESFNAIELGLGRIHILLAGTPGGIRKEWDSPGSVGTVLV